MALTPAEKLAKDLEVKVRFNWEDQLSKLVDGCTKDYMKANEHHPARSGAQSKSKQDVDMADISTGVRLPGGAKGVPPRPVAPNKLLQVGVPVLCWDNEKYRFVQKMLKVDNRLNFLIVAPGIPYPDSHEDRVCIRLHHIMNVHSGPRAVQLVERLSIKESALTSETVVIIQLDDFHPDVTPEKVVILLTPPQQGLKDCLESVIESVKAIESKKAAQEEKSGKVHKKLEEEETQHRRLVDMLRIENDVFSESQATIDLEVILRTAAADGGEDKEIVHKVDANLELEKYSQEAERFKARLGSLSAVDCRRVEFLLYEAAALRKWAKENFSETFPKGLNDFLMDDKRLTSDMQVKATLKGFDCLRRRQPNGDIGPPRRTPLDAYARGSVEAATMAMRQLLNLEEFFAEAKKSADLSKLVKELDGQTRTRLDDFFADPEVEPEDWTLWPRVVIKEDEPEKLEKPPSQPATPSGPDRQPVAVAELLALSLETVPEDPRREEEKEAALPEDTEPTSMPLGGLEPEETLSLTSKMSLLLLRDMPEEPPPAPPPAEPPPRQPDPEPQVLDLEPDSSGSPLVWKSRRHRQEAQEAPREDSEEALVSI